MQLRHLLVDIPLAQLCAVNSLGNRLQLGGDDIKHRAKLGAINRCHRVGLGSWRQLLVRKREQQPLLEISIGKCLVKARTLILQGLDLTFKLLAGCILLRRKHRSARVSTELISMPCPPAPSTRIDWASTSPGNPLSSKVVSPAGRCTVASRVTSAPCGYTVTASTTEVVVSSPAKAWLKLVVSSAKVNKLRRMGFSPPGIAEEKNPAQRQIQDRITSKPQRLGLFDLVQLLCRP